MALTATLDSALTTKAAVKIFLAWSDTTITTFDTAIDALISRYSAAISIYCDRVFTQTTWTEYYDGNGTVDLWLNHWPITRPMGAGQSINVDSSRIFGSSTALDEETGAGSGDFFIYPGERQGRVARLNGVWDSGVANIKVVYQAGYATIPPPIVEAVHLWVAKTYVRNEIAAHIITSETMGAGGGTRAFIPLEMPKDVRELLDQWRKMRIRG